MIFDIGPFRLYRVSEEGTLDITLICLEDLAVGWQYGWRDTMCDDKAWVDLRIGKLVIFYFEPHKNGFEIMFMGFWWIK